LQEVSRVTPHTTCAGQHVIFLQMKNRTLKPILFSRQLKISALAIICLGGIPIIAHAHDTTNHNDNHDAGILGFYPLRVVSGILVNLGDNLAGHGRRAVAQNPSYQNPQNDNRYSEEESPRRNSMETSVQMALARGGYYTGPIDGCIGPMSRRAISNYQADRGFRVTGSPDRALLISLGLQ